MKPLWVRLTPKDIVQKGDVWTSMAATDMNNIDYAAHSNYREFIFMKEDHFGRNAGSWSDRIWRFAGIAPEESPAEPNNTERKIELEL